MDAMVAFAAWKPAKYAEAEVDARARYAALPPAALVDEAVALKMAALHADHEGRIKHRQEQKDDSQVKCRMTSGERNAYRDAGTTPFLAATCSSEVLQLGVAFLKLTATHSGHHQRFGVLREFFAALWGGKFQEKMQQRVLARARIDVKRIVEWQTMHPRGLNDQGVDAMRDAQCPRF